jgi:glycosyltransferase involved in cell wall biosynthesis
LKRPARILILSPTVLPSVTGNSITTERWRQSLEKKGYVVRILATRGLDVTALLHDIERFQPDLVHAYHAFHSGVFLLDPRVSEACSALSIVVSLPGTDANLDAATSDRRDTIFRVCRISHAITAQSIDIVEQLKSILSDLQDRIAYVPKASLWLGNDVFDLRNAAGFNPGDTIFFLPAGIRPVKGNLECLIAFEKVHRARPEAKIVFSGMILDHEYGTRFQNELARFSSFAHWLQSISPEAMRSAYETSDVVLNSSFSEGLSNVLLEAISAGKPILASNIMNNRWLVLGDHGNIPCGRLYDPHDPDDLYGAAIELIDNEPLRRSMGEASRRKALTLPAPDDEASALIEVYERVITETSYTRGSVDA